MIARRCILFAVILVLGCATETKKSTPLLHYVPKNAAIIIQINDLDKFKKELASNDFLAKLKGGETYKSIFEKVKNLDYLNDSTQGILAFTQLKGQRSEFTFITGDRPDIFQLDSVANRTVEQLTIGTRNITKYQIANSALYSFSMDGKILICSSRPLLESLMENDGESKDRPILKRLSNIANTSKSATIFIDLEQVQPMFANILKADTEISATHFSDWIAMDFSADSNRMQFTGLTMANDSIDTYVNLFKNTRPMTNTAPSFAPFNTDAVLSYSFDDYRVFSENRQKYLKHPMANDSLFNTVEEIGIIWSNNQKSILLHTYGSENILEYLNGFKKGSYTFQGNEILEFGNSAFLKDYLYPLIDDFQPNFATILENAFVFSRHKEAVQSIISSYKNGMAFDKTTLFSTAKESLASESTILYISNSTGIESVVSDEFTGGLNQDIKKADLSKYVFGAQLVADDNFFHSNGVIQKIEKEVRKRRVSTLFDLQLDAPLANDPQFVTNHVNGQKEIVVQDMNNTLYLISAQGKIRWKKQLEGKIQGKIHQVDIYRNGRLQLAFNTNNQFLILDRNGKEVRPFTFLYEGGNLNPLAVFDYEGKKDYRFIVTQGEKVFMYNNKGKIVTGFKYTRAEDPILRAPKHIVIGKKDHLVFQLKDGTLKILNRIGDVRVKVTDKIDFSENAIYQYKNKFVTTDNKGVLYQIGTNGKVVKTNFNLNADHGLDATSNTLVYMNNNVLSIKGKKMELDLGVYTPPKIFYIYDKIYVGVTDIQNQQVYLFDSQAKPIANFPVYGTSKIDLNDMDNDKKIEIVVKSQDHSITVYTIN